MKKGDFFVSSAATPAALLEFPPSWVEAAWPASVDAWLCHVLNSIQFFLSAALRAAANP